MNVNGVRIISVSARILGWAYLLGLAGLVTLNHEGAAVRGQIARLRLASEKDDALACLLARHQLAGKLTHLRAITRRPRDPELPDPVLAPTPVILHLNGENLSRRRVEAFIPFDRKGRVIGNPLLMPADSLLADVCFPPYCWSAGPLRLLVLTTWEKSYRKARARELQFVYHAFRLGTPTSNKVLAVKFATLPGMSPPLRLGEDASGRPVLDVVVYTNRTTTTPAALSPQSGARFTWDDASGRFVGQERDPNGMWEVIPISEHESPPGDD